MAGTRLEAEVYIITSSITATQNLRKAVSRAGYRIERTIHEPLATARAHWPRTRRMSASPSSTSAAPPRSWPSSATARCATSRRSRGAAARSRTTWRRASASRTRRRRRRRRSTASRTPSSSIRARPWTCRARARARTRQVARELIAHIIEQRLDEILSLVAREIENAGEMGRLGAGAVLTGGGAGLTGAVEVAQHAFGMPVRSACPATACSAWPTRCAARSSRRRPGLALFAADAVGDSAFGARLSEGRPGPRRRLAEGVLLAGRRGNVDDDGWNAAAQPVRGGCG
jgi:cell division protein FtsA